MKEALFFTSGSEGSVTCRLCAHNCSIAPEKYGICGVRRNVKGTLFSLNYRECIAQNADPIEKKPLYHFLPGSKSWSIAAPGCNFKCGFCQNWNISQLRYEHFSGRIEPVEPGVIVRNALRSGSKSIAYTYTEPTVYYEFMIETAQMAVEKGLKNVMVSNGFIEQKPLEMLLPYMHAFNIDLKSFSDSFYRKTCGGRLQPVLDTLKRIRDAGRWLEITTLLIPDHNDSTDEISEIAAYIADLDKTIPWHVSRFFPAYHFDHLKEVTSDGILDCALSAANQFGVEFCYPGNTLRDNSTRCPQCSVVLVERNRYDTSTVNNFSGKCHNCDAVINGIWE